MSDNKSLRGAADRSRVSADELYEVKYLAKATGASVKEVRAAVKKVGPSRTRVTEELERVRRARAPHRLSVARLTTRQRRVGAALVGAAVVGGGIAILVRQLRRRAAAKLVAANEGELFAAALIADNGIAEILIVDEELTLR
jgi:hypothetical protein